MNSESSGFANKLRLHKTTLILAYQSIGIVYGDLSTSPIYVFKTTFSGRLRRHDEEDEIFGVLSLVFWTLTLIPLCKYVIFVLGADDSGEGGTFALYSLLSRHMKSGLLGDSSVPNDHSSVHNSEPTPTETKASSILKDFFDKSANSRIVLLLTTLLGTSMVVADGVLTPSMSVLSAVNGIKVKGTDLHDNYTVVIACVILVVLFGLQHFGTHRVGFMFAPIMLAWLLCISGVGIYNIIHWNPRVICALSPYYVYDFFKEAGVDGWSSLASIVLCITGAEAMFADLGHFSQLSIRIAFTLVVYPCLILAYMGEAAYLSKHKHDLLSSFYHAIPDSEVVFWPIFVIATLATVVASQAVISATFSIISQCRALRCFPRVNVIHTSHEVYGQIYIPEVNWILMVLCLLLVAGIRDTDMIGKAYGFAVISVMFNTTCLMFLVITMVWKKHVLIAIIFVLVFGSIELLYFSSCLAKIHKGGWLALIISLVVLSVMCIWHYGTLKKHAYEADCRVDLDTVLNLGENLGINRVPGICLIYSNVVSGMPPMFAHFVTNFPTFHEFVIFVTIKTLTVPKVNPTQQFLVTRIGPSEIYLFRCIVKYGYKDAKKDHHAFEDQLIKAVADCLQQSVDNSDFTPPKLEMSVNRKRSTALVIDENEAGLGCSSQKKKVRFLDVNIGRRELEKLMEARESGLTYMMGSTYVVARETSSRVKKFVINIVYGFLRQNCRSPATTLSKNIAQTVHGLMDAMILSIMLAFKRRYYCHIEIQV
ncbi:hypothetical protein ACFE04_012848 [Oxalis oulophora]